MIRIAIDAMGGDDAPEVVVQGALMSLIQYDDIHIELFGDEARILNILEGDLPERMSLVHCESIIRNDEEPVRAFRKKKDSSIVKGIQSLKDEQNEVFVSAGSTGAVFASGLLGLKRIKGIDRPGILPTIPTVSEETPYFLLMDAGANIDADANNLYQYALLANFYAKEMLGLDKPRIGLLNIGTEEGKGTDTVKEAYNLIKENADLHFIGNVEPNNLLEGVADVVIADGFTANILLKTLEGTAKSLLGYLGNTLKNGNIQTKIGGLLVKEALKKSMHTMNPQYIGGAVLLGIQKPVVIAHGSSNAEAIFHAIRQARDLVERAVVKKTIAYFEE